MLDIEKSRFRRGEYVMYGALGTYRVRAAYRTKAQSSRFWVTYDGPAWLEGRTLAELSKAKIQYEATRLGSTNHVS